MGGLLLLRVLAGLLLTLQSLGEGFWRRPAGRLLWCRPRGHGGPHPLLQHLRVHPDLHLLLLGGGGLRGPRRPLPAYHVSVGSLPMFSLSSFSSSSSLSLLSLSRSLSCL